MKIEVEYVSASWMNRTGTSSPPSLEGTGRNNEAINSDQGDDVMRKKLINLEAKEK